MTDREALKVLGDYIADRGPLSLRDRDDAEALAMALTKALGDAYEVRESIRFECTEYYIEH